MRIEQDSLGRAKQGIHVAQVLFIFIAACLALAVLCKPGQTGGQTGFFFGLAFLSVPALVYQVMVPLWTRAWRFANVYAYAVLDILFTILWFSASIAVSTWNAAGIREGENSDKNTDGDCGRFAYGDSTKCKVSKASVGLGIIVFLLFGATACISVLFVKQYRSTGVIPGRREKPSTHITPVAEDPGKDPWSTSIEERDPDELLNDPDDRLRYGQATQEEDEQRLLHNTASRDTFGQSNPQPGRPLEHVPSNPKLHVAHQYDDYVPSALGPGGYVATQAPVYQPPPPESHFGAAQQGRIDFPVGNYHRV